MAKIVLSNSDSTNGFQSRDFEITLLESDKARFEAHAKLEAKYIYDQYMLETNKNLLKILIKTYKLDEDSILRGEVQDTIDGLILATGKGKTDVDTSKSKILDFLGTKGELNYEQIPVVVMLGTFSTYGSGYRVKFRYRSVYFIFVEELPE